MNLVFIGSKSNSGYGVATESFKQSFGLIKNINIEYKIYNDIINYNKSKKYDIEFILGHPPYSSDRIGNYRIIYFYWETDRLPVGWVDEIKKADEIWAPCKLVETVCRDSGYNGIIKIIPTPTMAVKDKYIDIKLRNKISNYFINNNFYKFYSIFQWQPRKGYNELLHAYFEEFKNENEVFLILKVSNIPGVNNSDIVNFIKNIKSKYKSNAHLFLITEYLSDIEIYSLHRYSDCFVLPHYGEGWGMPIHEAALFGNPIITTKYGGITEILNNNIYWIDHNMAPVSGMEWNKLYSCNQNWAKPDTESLKRQFRFLYSNKIKKSFSFEDFSIKNVSKIIENRIKELGN